MKLHLCGPLGRQSIVAGVLVDFMVPVSIALVHYSHVERGSFEVVVYVGDLAGADRAIVREIIYRLLFCDQTRVVMEANFAFSFNGAVHGFRVGKNNGVGILCVLEEIEDALFLQDAADEAEIALPVLGAVASFRVIRFEFE